MFKQINREQNRLRMAIDGPAGSGKTYTALRIAFVLAGPNGRVAVIDTEHGSAAKYAGDSPDGIPWKWDGLNLEHFAPSNYEQAIKAAGQSGYDVLVIDSLSHAWMGVGGALDQIDRSRDANKFTAWKDVTPQHTAMIEAILHSNCHVIVTLRSKMEYVLEDDERGKKVPKKIGMKPIQRDGVEYEFDLVCDLDLSHTMKVSKSRCSSVDQAVVNCPTGSFIEPVRQWLFSGSPRIPTNGGITIDAKIPMAEEHHVKRLIELAQALEWTPNKLADILARKNLTKIAQLSRADAEDLIQAMEWKQTQKQGEEAF